jgi:2-oxoisovalerate dehydrogenase E1 component
VSTPPKAALAKAATRAVNRAEIVDANFLQFLDAWPEPVRAGNPDAPVSDGLPLTGREALQIFEAQILSRHLDLEARAMRGRGEGYYTIGSSGHEGNAVIGFLTRTTDPAFLHYRSGGFMMARGLKTHGCDPVYDTALSLAASREDPISGGRHKVWGSKPGWVLPQTSTIASHLSKAVGAALGLEQAKRLKRELPVPADSIIVCSFGDASANHAAALAAFNTAEWTAYQKLPVPILFVCEDNGIGISVRTPSGWIAHAFSNRLGLSYVQASGLDIAETHEAAKVAIDHCRSRRAPVFLHLTLQRLLAHAGTDAETEYRSLAEIEASEGADPLKRSAEILMRAGVATPADLRARYETARERTRKAAAEAARRPKLTSPTEIMHPLAPYTPDAVQREAGRSDYGNARLEAFGGEAGLPERASPRHLALQINRALHDLMVKYPEMLIFGEDVAQKGGVYTVTSGLAQTFKGSRVFNTLLDETTILGLAQGAAYMGLLPFPEIQYLAYYHNACDQIRGEACSLQYFSNDQFRNGMVMRVASLGYQKGFGGHFHNDNSFTALRDIPSLIIACPSRGDDAAMMLRTCAALARVDGRVVAFMEPIALYMTKDLYEAKDGLWQFGYPPIELAAPLGEPRIYNPNARDLLIVTYGNGVCMSLRVAREIERQRGAQVRVLDLRWLKPLNAAAIAHHASDVGRVLVVDEGRRTGGIAEEIFTVLDEHAPEVRKSRVAGEDCYIPLAAAANLVLVSEPQITEAALALL